MDEFQADNVGRGELADFTLVADEALHSEEQRAVLASPYLRLSVGGMAAVVIGAMFFLVMSKNPGPMVREPDDTLPADKWPTRMEEDPAHSLLPDGRLSWTVEPNEHGEGIRHERDTHDWPVPRAHDVSPRPSEEREVQGPTLVQGYEGVGNVEPYSPQPPTTLRTRNAEAAPLTFSVKYTFTFGSPTGSTDYVWVITRARGSPARCLAMLARDGTLETRLWDWNSADGPFQTHIEDRHGHQLSESVELPTSRTIHIDQRNWEGEPRHIALERNRGIDGRVYSGELPRSRHGVQVREGVDRDTAIRSNEEYYRKRAAAKQSRSAGNP